MATCDKCGKVCTSQSYDVWVAVTTYDADGEVVKTMEEVSPDILTDYIVFCRECLPTLQLSWQSFLRISGVTK